MGIFILKPCFTLLCIGTLGVLEMAASKLTGRKNEEGTCQKRPFSSSAENLKEVSLKHKKVQQTLQTFRDLSSKLLCQYETDQLGHLKAKTKALMEAAMLMKRKHQWENTKKRVGHVEGIEVGDGFQYRTELNVIGLHHQFSSGIDYMGKYENSLATSIVVTDRYANVIKSGGCLIYIGHGGNPNVRSDVLPHDQKLEGGNLALRNSMIARSPVRVILKVCRKSDGSNSNYNCSYIYDGLYSVDNMTQERGQFGKLVFKFIMNRILDQPMCVSPKDVVMEGGFTSFTQKKRQKSIGHVARKDVVRVNDVSEGKEKFPIRVVTPTDCVQISPSFDYVVDMVYPERFKQPILYGCDCSDACVDYLKCACIIKNGGAMPYDCNKRLASPMKSSLIYECGPSCKCSSSCINRISQCGIQFQLEIFKTELKGWGIRPRTFIPSGSFVCEFIGEVHRNRKSGSRLDVDDCTFEIGAGKGFIDATRRGNIGRFINHSCSPNLCVKDIMYDHDDKNLPHKMLFAVKDIPAGRELSYDYNCCNRKVIKVGSNCCYCGSPECNKQVYI